MKQLLFFVMMIISTLSVSAQKYYVYSVLGKVTAAGKSITPKMIIGETTNIVIAENSRLVVVNEAKKQMCVIRGAAKGNVKQLLSGKSASIKTVSPQYIAILMKRNPNTAGRSTHMQSAATSFRDLDSLAIAEDSISANKDSIINKADTVKHDSAESFMNTMHFGLTKESTLCQSTFYHLNSLTRLFNLPCVYKKPSEIEA